MTPPRETCPKFSNDFSRAPARMVPKPYQDTASIWFRYVPLHLVGEFLARGWTIDDDMADCHHGAHAILMRIECESEPT